MVSTFPDTSAGCEARGTARSETDRADRVVGDGECQ